MRKNHHHEFTRPSMSAQRILSLDLARGFTVFFIPIVHTVMLYGSLDVHQSSFGKVLAFIAEWPGAQVFMLLMGVGIGLKKPASYKYTIIRSSVFLGVGYSLNFLKFVVPLWCNGLPPSFLQDMNTQSWIRLLLTGDILQFAAVAIIVLWMIQQLTDPIITALLLAFGVAFIGPVSWFGSPPVNFFPLFPWLVYPLAGFVIGRSIKEHGNKIFLHLAWIGAGLMLSAFCFYMWQGSSLTPFARNDSSFYETTFWDTITHLAFVLIWLSIWQLISKIKMNYLFQFLIWCSRSITLIYCIQWPLIFWFLPLFGYHQLDVYECVVISIDVSLVTFLLTAIIRHAFRKRI